MNSATLHATTLTTDEHSNDVLKSARRWVVSQCRVGCEEELRVGMETVEILKSLEMDEQGLLVGLLQPLLPITDKEKTLIADHFGALTLSMLQRTARMQQLSSLSQSGDSKANEENLRKMLIAMVDDVRVVLIELARHLSILRQCKQVDSAAQTEIGHLTMEVYAPLANRLGVWQLKWRMEDYALRFLEPDDYRDLAAALHEKRTAREKYISEFIQIVQEALQSAAIVGEVHGRPKHLYSIWKKMRRKGLAFENLRDIRAVRVLVDDVADCYSVLAILHTNWQAVSGEFDDYIATPKDNGYRSIHTVVIGPREQNVEVQIRTHEMHQQSELGVAAHWRYKENVRADDNIDNKVLRLRQLLQWKEELQSDDVENAGDDNIDERVYVFTPKGTVIDLPSGSTPIDFAYAIHTEIGHCTRGAKVNGKMVPLGYQLQTGDQVHIHSVKGGHPSRDWLRADLGYVRTRRARNRISLWFKHADYDQHLADGRIMLERELSRLRMGDLAYDKILRETHFHKTDDMLAALGAHDFKLSKALAPFRRAQKLASPTTPPSTTALPRIPTRTSTKARRESKHADRFSVNGVDNLLTRIANCCHPIPGDPIIGFITAGRGISIHRQDCNNLNNLDPERRSRLLEVQWNESDSTAYPVAIQIVAYHRNDLLNDITQLLKDKKVEVLKLVMQTDDENNATIQLTLEITDLRKLTAILSELAGVPDVVHVKRNTS